MAQLQADWPTPLDLDLRRSSSRRSPWVRFFFLGYGVLFLVIALVGFVPDYFMPTGGNGGLPISTTGHIHGACMAALLLLFLTQSWLVVTRRVKWHRKLGLTSFVIVPACWVTMMFAVRRNLFLENPVIPSMYDLLAVQLMTLVLFPTFFIWGYLARFKPDSHRRLIVFMIAVPLQPGTDRIVNLHWLPHVGLSGSWDWDLYVYAMLVPLIIFDLCTLKRIHRTTLICLALTLAGHAVVNTIARTPGWYELAARISEPFR